MYFQLTFLSNIKHKTELNVSTSHGMKPTMDFRMILLLWLQQYHIINTCIYYKTAALREKQRDILSKFPGLLVFPLKKVLINYTRFKWTTETFNSVWRNYSVSVIYLLLTAFPLNSKTLRNEMGSPLFNAVKSWGISRRDPWNPLDLLQKPNASGQLHKFLTVNCFITAFNNF